MSFIQTYEVIKGDMIECHKLKNNSRNRSCSYVQTQNRWLFSSLKVFMLPLIETVTKGDPLSPCMNIRPVSQPHATLKTRLGLYPIFTSLFKFDCHRTSLAIDLPDRLSCIASRFALRHLVLDACCHAVHDSLICAVRYVWRCGCHDGRCRRIPCCRARSCCIYDWPSSSMRGVCAF